MADVTAVVLMLSALAIAPFVGGGFGELAGGVLQILVFAGMGCWLLVRRKNPAGLARAPGIWFAAALVLLVVASAYTTHSIYFSLNSLVFTLACLGAYVLAATVCRDKQVAAAAVWTLLVSAMLVSVLAIRQYAFEAGGGPNFWRSILSPGEHARLFGPFINPSFFAGYLVIALPVTLGAYLVTRRTVLAMLAGIGFTLDLLALMLTGAKFGIVAGVAALGIFFLLAIFTGSLRRARFARLLVICVVVLPLLILFSAPVRSRIQAAEAGGTQVHSTVFRIYTWQATLDMIIHRPWLGVGAGTFAITYPRYTVAGPTKLAHDSYLQVAAECGVPALAALLLLLGAIAHRSLVGISSGSIRPADHPREGSDEPASDSITWSDLVPFSGWRLMNCAVFAALFGSAIRSLVDSDWYVLGIALPFWMMAGALVAQSGAAESDTRKRGQSAPLTLWDSSLLRGLLVAICAAGILLSVSFGLGDFYANRAQSAAEARPDDAAPVVDLYRRATLVSPLAPEYHRQLGMWLGLGEGDFEAGEREVETSIHLAPDTSEGGWYAKALLEGERRDWPAAIASLQTALKFSPNSTQALHRLAQAYQAAGDQRGCESVFGRLLDIETSPYEEIKGTPELVDTTFAVARAYFGEKNLRHKRYNLAISGFQMAIDRLERWRSSGDMRKVQKMMGLVSAADERSNLDLLRQCYRGLAATYLGLGNKREAAVALAKAGKVR